MAVNRLRSASKPATETRSGGGKSIFSMIDSLLQLDKRFANGLPLQYLPKAAFLILIAIFYIANSHHADRTSRKMDKLKAEVEDLRADYTTLKASYMYDSKQSEVARKVAIMDIQESVAPPYVVKIEK